MMTMMMTVLTSIVDLVENSGFGSCDVWSRFVLRIWKEVIFEVRRGSVNWTGENCGRVCEDEYRQDQTACLYVVGMQGGLQRVLWWKNAETRYA